MRDWWLVIDGDGTDLCRVDPGFEIDVLITADLRAMTSVWMGVTRFVDEIETGAIRLDASPMLQRQVKAWMTLSVFAPLERMVE